MKIAIITNPDIEEFIEDNWIAKSFENDGHEVFVVNKNYKESLEKECDVFLKRNCWSVEEKDFILGQEGDTFKKRLVAKNLPRINCDGKFDGSGKNYLCKFYKLNEQVIPSVATAEEIDN